MADGMRIEVFANLGSLADAKTGGGQWRGGLRPVAHRFLFLSRETAPDEDEQAAVYQAIADARSTPALIVRTLDIGSDKPAPYLPIPPEDNPRSACACAHQPVAAGICCAPQLRASLRVRRWASARSWSP